MILIMNHWKEIKEIAEQGLPNKASVNGTEIELRGREWEKAFPLLVMARFFDKYKGNDEISRKVWEFLLDQQQKTIEISLDSFDQVIIESLDEVLKRKVIVSVLGLLSDYSSDLLQCPNELQSFKLRTSAYIL